MPLATKIRDEIEQAVPGLAPVSRGMPTRPIEEGDDDETIAGLHSEHFIGLYDLLNSLAIQRKYDFTTGRVERLNQIAVHQIRKLGVPFVVMRHDLVAFVDETDPAPKVIFGEARRADHCLVTHDETSVIESPAVGADLAAIDACD